MTHFNKSSFAEIALDLFANRPNYLIILKNF